MCDGMIEGAKVQHNYCLLPGEEVGSESPSKASKYPNAKYMRAEIVFNYYAQIRDFLCATVVSGSGWMARLKRQGWIA